MSDQLLPDFDGPRDAPTPAGPKKPRPRPQRKRPVKKVKAPVLKPAKRVPKKRRVRKTTPLPVTRPNEPLLSSKEFDVTLQVFKILGEFDPQIRKRMLARLQDAL